MKKSWLEEFSLENDSKVENYVKTDYEVFEDKNLLDEFRNTIIQELIDKNIRNDENLHQYINEEINRVTDGYDLSNEERNHLFNLIENGSTKFGFS